VEEGGELYNSRLVYDVVGDEGNPMLVFITYGYNHGFIEPSYSTIYGLRETFVNSQAELVSYISESIDLYNTHKKAVD